MRNLTWDDITIDFSEINIPELYSHWSWLFDFTEPIRPLMMSTFGDLFFQKKDMKVYFIDTIEGTLSEFAESESEFIKLINTPENIENFLLSNLVLTLIENNKILTKGKSYSFEIPMILGGKETTDNVEISDLVVWVSIIGQIHKQVKDLPIGTKISGFKME